MLGRPLRAEERTEIYARIEPEESPTPIVRHPGRAALSVWRKVERNVGCEHHRTAAAHRCALRCRQRRKNTRFHADPVLTRCVEERLAAKDSPTKVVRVG
jgi:IS30 family transposase